MHGYLATLITIALVINSYSFIAILLKDMDWKTKKEKYGKLLLILISSTLILLSIYLERLIGFFQNLLA